MTKCIFAEKRERLWKQQVGEKQVTDNWDYMAFENEIRQYEDLKLQYQSLIINTSILSASFSKWQSTEWNKKSNKRKIIPSSLWLSFSNSIQSIICSNFIFLTGKKYFSNWKNIFWNNTKMPHFVSIIAAFCRKRKNLTSVKLCKTSCQEWYSAWF